MENFMKIKYYCDKIAQNPSIEDIKKLTETLENTDNNFLQKMQQYILLPLALQLDNINEINKNEIKTHLIYTIQTVIRQTKLNAVVPYKTILIILLKQIYDFKKSSVMPDLSEELKLAITRCIDTASLRLASEVIENFFTKDNSTLITQIIFVCVQLIEHEKYRILRIAAINCILSVLQIHDKSDFDDIVLRNQISNIVFILIPKLLKTLSDVALGDSTQGHQLILPSVKAIGRIVCLIMEDNGEVEIEHGLELSDFKKLFLATSEHNKTDDEILGMSIVNKLNETRGETLVNLTRTSEWLAAASRKLKPSIQKLISLCGNQNSKIRAELGNAVRSWICKCANNLQICLPSLFEIIIILSDDKDKSVSIVNSAALETCQGSKTYSIIVDSLEELFHLHLIRLPRIIHREDENQQLVAFSLLKGQLKFLPEDKLSILLKDEKVLEQFVQILLSAIELNLDDDLLKEEIALREINDIPLNIVPWKKFKHFSSQLIVDKFRECCTSLNGKTVLQILINHLLDLFISQVASSNEIIVLINYLITEEGNFQVNLLKIIIDELLSDVHWNLSLKVEEQQNRNNCASTWSIDRTEGLYESSKEVRYTDLTWTDTEEDTVDDHVTTKDVKFNVLHTCLLLETVGNIAVTMKQEFQPYVFKVLHHFLAKTGSTNYFVHTAGLYGLNKLRDAFRYETIQELIYRNTDYITYYINRSLKRSENITNGLDVLGVVLRYCTSDSVANLENTINTLLIESSKYYKQNNLTSYLKVFSMLLENINLWYVTENNTKEASMIETCQSLSELWNKNLYSGDTEFKTDIIETNDPEVNEEALENESMEIEEKQSELPKHIQLSKEILLITLKHISSKNQSQVLLALDATISGLNIIKSYENELLPLVHLIWYPLAERFKDKNPIILRKCFTLLLVLAETSKDFILRRTLTDVVPIINKLIMDSSKNTVNHIRDPSYAFTQEHKLLIHIVENYSVLIKNLGMEEKDLDIALNSGLIFLNKSQPKTLQNASLKFYNEMLKFDGGATYLKVLQLKEIFHKF